MATTNLQQYSSNKKHTLKIKLDLKSVFAPRPNPSLTQLGDETLYPGEDLIQCNIMVISNILIIVE